MLLKLLLISVDKREKKRQLKKVQVARFFEESGHGRNTLLKAPTNLLLRVMSPCRLSLR